MWSLTFGEYLATEIKSSRSARINPRLDANGLRKFLNLHSIIVRDTILHANNGYIVKDDRNTWIICNEQ